MNFNNFSIRTKLILLLSSSAIIALTISFFASAYYMVNTQRENSLHNLTQIARVTGHNLNASLEFDDVSSTKKILEPLKINKHIMYALVFTNNNSLFASYINLNVSNIALNPNNLKLKYPSKEIVHNTTNKNFSVTVPIFLGDDLLGYIKIVSDTKELDEAIESILIRQFIIGTSILILIILISFKLHKIFTRPIFDLLAIMKKVSSGANYDVDVQNKYKDEFKDLYSGFSLMLSTMHEQKEKIEFIHKQTRDSIEYSANIQVSLLPKKEEMIQFFEDTFTIWKPKDTVGGDIYLFETLRHEDEALLMVIDCTGHGVPGAFVTMIVKAIEREIVAKLIKSDFDINPAIIMAHFNKNMQLLLHQDDKKSTSNAGFDGAIVYINKRENILRYAGSNTPLFIVQNDKLEVIKGDKESIGYKKSNPEYNFKMHERSLDAQTKVYLTTDGYLDQTGGEKGFLFGKKRFSKLIESIYMKSFLEQKLIFRDTFNEYKKNNETKDDMTLVAFSINQSRRKNGSKL